MVVVGSLPMVAIIHAALAGELPVAPIIQLARVLLILGQRLLLWGCCLIRRL